MRLRFAVRPGAFSDEPIGPHPISQFNVIFETQEFQNVVPWLMLNREGLDVLVHPLTESSYDDHSKNALWLGTPVPMLSDAARFTAVWSGWQGDLPPGNDRLTARFPSIPGMVQQGV